MTRNPFDDVVAREAPTTLDAPQVHAEARALLERALGSVQATGTPRWIVLLGEPGLGKTHLLGWLRRRLARSAFISPLRDARTTFRHLWRETARSLATPPVAAASKPAAAGVTESQARILRALAGDGRHVDQLCTDCQTPMPRLLADLLVLEMQGRVRSAPGGRYIGVAG